MDYLCKPIAMERVVKYTVCHGSGNRFVMIDAVAQREACDGADFAAWAVGLCAKDTPIGGADGLLMLVEFGGGYAMRMFNPDGSEAEMCGNGIRCAARQAQQYIGRDEFSVWSGGQEYRITHERPVWPGVETYGVEIPVSLQSGDFGFAADGAEFIGRPIERLHEGLRFTALNLGNPHITACVERIDYELLTQLGERVKELRDEFPNGVNVSLFEHTGPQQIFVATYERGAGITASCGTAMTASATAAALLGLTEFGKEVEVRNRGGAVRCLPRREADGRLVTRLTGNATFESEGTFVATGEAEVGDIRTVRTADEEQSAYDAFVNSITR